MDKSSEQNPFRSPVSSVREDDGAKEILWRVRLSWQLPLVTLLLFLESGVLGAAGLPVVVSLGLGLAGLLVYSAGIVMMIYGIWLTNSVRGIEMHVLAGILMNMFVLLGLPFTFNGV